MGVISSEDQASIASHQRYLCLFINTIRMRGLVVLTFAVVALAACCQGEPVDGKDKFDCSHFFPDTREIVMDHLDQNFDGMKGKFSKILPEVDAAMDKLVKAKFATCLKIGNLIASIKDPKDGFMISW